MVNISLSRKTIKRHISSFTAKARKAFKTEAIKPLSECVPIRRSPAEGTQSKQNLLRWKKLSKYFPQAKNENIIDSFSCTLVGANPAQGRLYLTENHIAFHSAVFRSSTKVLVNLKSVASAIGEGADLLIRSERQEHTFSLRRETAERALSLILPRLCSLQEPEIADQINASDSDDALGTQEMIASSKADQVHLTRKEESSPRGSRVRAPAPRVLLLCVLLLAASGTLLALRIATNYSNSAPEEEAFLKLSQWDEALDDAGGVDLRTLLDKKLLLLDKIHRALEDLSDVMILNVTSQALSCQ